MVIISLELTHVELTSHPVSPKSGEPSEPVHVYLNVELLT